MAPVPFRSIAQIVSRHAEGRGAHVAIRFLHRGETESERLTYSDLKREIDCLSQGLADAGLAGLPIAISLPAGSGFASLFLACLNVGAVAVPVPYPDMDRNVDRIGTIVGSAKPAAIVTDEAGVPRVAKTAPSTPILTADRLRADPRGPVERAVDPDACAFVQYTSGSTSAPKGIAITHGNLVANQRMIAAAFGHDASLVGVNWLPHHHDMGLIGTILQPLYLGGTANLMAARAFVQKPIRWLRAIEKFGATTAGGPCFGYELCTRMISDEDASSLDLSSWNVAFCGAEPVRAAVLEKFAAHFRAGGFRKTAFLPCYGLAETTLIAASAQARAGYTQREFAGAASGGASRTFVSCGKPATDCSIVLRSEDGAISESSDGKGEICIGGPHVSPGYWDGETRRPIPFANAFVRGGMRYLPTGDIGIFADGELFPVDRISDTIILYGTKLHAADVEATVLDDPQASEVRAAAAFATDDGRREKLVLLCEIDRRAAGTPAHARLAECLPKRIGEIHGVVPTVEFVAYGSLPRTSSGKIKRADSKAKFLCGEARLLMVEEGV